MVGKEHKSAPDLINPVLGFKVLQINHLGVISSAYQPQCIWQTPKQTARCIRHEATQMFVPKPAADKHASPHPDCQCGLYSYYDLENVNRAPVYKGLPVMTIVSCSGAIEAHVTGMRAEYAEIKAISVADHHRPRTPLQVEETNKCVSHLRRRAKAWKIPFLVDFTQLPVIAAELGLYTLPESLRPE